MGMRIAHIHNPLLARACVECPDTPPTCNCPSGQQCTLTAKACDACPTMICDAPVSSSSGTSKGAMAGAVVGILIFLFLVVGGFLWWRRRSNVRRMLAANREKAVENVPGVPSNVGGGNPALGGTLRGTAGLEKGTTTPEPHLFNDADSNPFADQSVPGSIRSGQSIPIGLASDGALSPGIISPTGTAFSAPVRPQRSPELNIRNNPTFLDRPTSQLQPPRPGYAPSQRSEFTVSSMGSTASSAMEAMYESPTIVTAGSRQVIGAVRAEVVQVGGLHSPMSSRANSQTRRSQPGPSPLASSHFTGNFPPIEEDPFGDNAESYLRPESAASNMTFGSPLASSHLNSHHSALTSSGKAGTLDDAPVPLPHASSSGDINHPLASASSMRTHDPTKESTYDLYYNPSRRTSQESVVSNTYSVLAGFPFVPPSPLPSSAPRSPLSIVLNPNRQSIASSTASRPSSPAPPLPTTNPASTIGQNASKPSTNGLAYATPAIPDDESLRRPSRAASTMSHASSSSALDAFQFHFADGTEEPLPPLNPAFFGHGNNGDSISSTAPVNKEAGPTRGDRASLDTLALSRSLAANRLSYD